MKSPVPALPNSWPLTLSYIYPVVPTRTGIASNIRTSLSHIFALYIFAWIYCLPPKRCTEFVFVEKLYPTLDISRINVSSTYAPRLLNSNLCMLIMSSICAEEAPLVNMPYFGYITFADELGLRVNALGEVTTLKPARSLSSSTFNFA